MITTVHAKSAALTAQSRLVGYVGISRYLPHLNRRYNISSNACILNAECLNTVTDDRLVLLGSSTRKELPVAP